MIERYCLGFVARRTDPAARECSASVRSAVTLRPKVLRTGVTEPGVATVAGLAIDGAEQLLAPVDAYEFSSTLVQKLNAAFLKKHGLEGVTDEALDRWLDDREWSMPGDSVGRLALPVVVRDKEVVIRVIFGQAAGEVILSLVGWAMAERNA